MLVTLLGIATPVSPPQPQNALSPMLVMLPGIVTFVKKTQPPNAFFPMFVTPGVITAILTPAPSHGTSSRNIQSVIFPVPLIVSTPSSVNSHVRFSPQVPELITVEAGAASVSVIWAGASVGAGVALTFGSSVGSGSAGSASIGVGSGVGIGSSVGSGVGSVSSPSANTVTGIVLTISTIAMANANSLLFMLCPSIFCKFQWLIVYP